MNNRPAYYSVLCACFLAVSLLCASSAQSQNAAPSKALIKGFGLYDSRRYAEATVVFKSVLEGETKDSLPNKQRAEYFMVKALYQLRLYAVALAYLDGIASTGSTNLYYGVSLKWLVALSRVLPENSGVQKTLATYDRSLFEEPVNGDVRDELLYMGGRHLQRKGKTDTAIALLEKISQASYMRRKARFILGVAHVTRGEAKLALAAFQEVLTLRFDKSSGESAEESVRVKALATLQLARIHYANKDFKTSIDFYRRIPKNSPKHQEAQFELSWAYYLAGHFSNALATLYALGANPDNAQVMPESSLLRSVIFHKLCQYEQGLANLEAHEQRYGGLASQLAAFIDRYEDNAEFAMYLNQVGKKARSSLRPVETFVVSILQEGRSKKLLEWDKQLRSELEIVEKADPAWQTSSIGQEAMQELTLQLALAEADFGRSARKQLQEALSGLKENATSIAKTKLEIQTAASTPKSSATPAKADAPFVIDASHPMWSINQGFGKGPAGHYQFQVASRCTGL